MELSYRAPRTMDGVPLTCEQAVQELWKGRSWVLVQNDETHQSIRLNLTPDNSFLMMAAGTMVEFGDVMMAMNVSEMVLRGEMTLEQVKELHPPTRLAAPSPNAR